eukprot:6688374-Prymnesium_polylepis.2
MQDVDDDDAPAVPLSTPPHRGPTVDGAAQRDQAIAWLVYRGGRGGVGRLLFVYERLLEQDRRGRNTVRWAKLNAVMALDRELRTCQVAPKAAVKRLLHEVAYGCAATRAKTLSCSTPPPATGLRRFVGRAERVGGRFDANLDAQRAVRKGAELRRAVLRADSVRGHRPPPGVGLWRARHRRDRRPRCAP